jgi:peptide deformylase
LTAERDPERIRSFGSRILRRVAAPLTPGSPETKALLDSLWESLQTGGGVGLAAPQIGVAGRAVVIRDPGKTGPEERIDLVNPVLKKSFGPVEIFEEGCLSFPGVYFDVRRPRGAVIEYLDAEGHSCRLKDDRLLSRIAQHELDHLDGILFIDRVSAWKRFWLGPRLLWVILAGFLAGKWNGQ